MQPSQPNRRRARLRLLSALLGLMLVVAACAPTNVAPPSTSTPPVVAPATSAPATSAAAQPTDAQAAAAAIGSDKEYSQDPAPSAAVSPAGAKTRHFMGDPNASVVIVEISDFQ